MTMIQLANQASALLETITIIIIFLDAFAVEGGSLFATAATRSSQFWPLLNIDYLGQRALCGCR